MKNIVILIGSFVVVSAVVGGVLLLKARSVSPAVTTDSVNKQEVKPLDTQDTNSQAAQLQSTDEVLGTGAEAVAGKKVTVNYVGTLTNGTKFDASADHGSEGFSFVLGAGNVIKGWDQGVAGMKVGGKRKLVIPPELGYGSRGAGASIPPNSTLVFEIELLKVD